MKKQVLIITYYWPPAGGPGVQRWLKMVKYLPEFDIEPIVYCPQNPSYPIVDESLLKEIPKQIKVIKQPIKEPYRFANLLSNKSATTISSGIIPKKKKQTLIQRLLLYVRGNFFIPDARKSWVKPSVVFLSDYIKTHNIETIITTGPPHSLHLIGMALKQQLKVKWLADFRDPWTTIGYHKQLKLTSSSAEKHRQLESNVLQSADGIIVTSENTKTEFATKTNTPIKVITNGYDSHHLHRPEKDKQFTVAHIGSLLSERNPKQLWQALRELCDENDDFRSAFRLKLIGVVSEEVLHTLADFQLDQYIDNLGYRSHDDAIIEQMASRILLQIEIDSEDTKAIIPGKLFEYMASETPIIAVGPNGSDVERILRATNTGHYFGYHDKDKIKSQFLLYFQAYKSNTLSVQAIGLQQYSRKSLAKSLSELLN